MNDDHLVRFYSYKPYETIPSYVWNVSQEQGLIGIYCKLFQGAFQTRRFASLNNE